MTSTTHMTAGFPLGEFLASADLMTADPMEALVLAEMEGFTDRRAREAGYESLLDAVQQLRPAKRVHKRVEVEVPELPVSVLYRAFLRGLLFVAPLAPLFVLLPRTMSTADYWLVTLAVIVAWGLGMGMSHVTRSHAAYSPGSQFRAVLSWQAMALAGTALVGLVAAAAGLPIGLAAVAWSGLHILYVLSANVLIASGAGRALAVALVPGVLAAAVHWGTGGTITSTPAPAVFAIALASVLGAIVYAAVRVWRTSRGQLVLGGQDRDLAIPRFIVYGVLIARTVLWLPINTPGFVTGYLGLALILCLGVTEVAAQYIRRSGRRDLTTATHVSTFRSQVQRTIALGVSGYAVALATVLALMATPLIIAGEDAVAIMVDSSAVLVLGVIQLLALLGVAYHAIGRVSIVLGLGMVALFGTRVLDEAAADSTITTGFLVVAIAVATALALTAVRAGRSPINHW